MKKILAFLCCVTFVSQILMASTDTSDFNRIERARSIAYHTVMDCVSEYTWLAKDKIVIGKRANHYLGDYPNIQINCIDPLLVKAGFKAANLHLLEYQEMAMRSLAGYIYLISERMLLAE